MEQKKILWIIASVGVFLLAVFLGAILFFRPATRPDPIIATITPVEKNEPKEESGWQVKPEEIIQIEQIFSEDEIIEETENPEEVPVENEGLNVSDLFVVSENTTVYDLNQKGNTAESTTIDLNALKNSIISDVQAQTQTQAQTPAQTQPQNINITVNIPETTKTATSTATVKEPVIDYSKGAAAAEKAEKEASVQKTSTPSTVTPTTTKPAATSTTTAKPATTTTASKPATTTTAATTTKPAATTTVTTASKPITRYWVQVASYTNKKTAETAREKLVNNKIIADIFTYQDSTGKLYYRVRVGPYTTKSEAEYWMAKVNQIPDFAKAGSYITKTTD